MEKEIMNRITLLLSLLFITMSAIAQNDDPFEKFLKVEPAVAFNQLTIWDTDFEVTDEIKARYKEAQALYNNQEYGRAHSHFQYLYTTSFQAIELYEYMGIIELIIERKDMGQAQFLALNNSIVDEDLELQSKAIWYLAYSVYKQGMEKSTVKALEILQKLDVKNDYTRSAATIIDDISR